MEMIGSQPKASLTRAVQVLLAASVLAYVAALIGPGLGVEIFREGGLHPGWMLFVEGLIGLFIGYFAWLANPMTWAAWVFLLQRRYGAATNSGLAALALGLTFLGHEQIPVGSSGNYPFVVKWGYWSWLLSAAMVAAAGVAGLVDKLAAAKKHG
jgi:hypothetical protein